MYLVDYWTNTGCWPLNTTYVEYNERRTVSAILSPARRKLRSTDVRAHVHNMTRDALIRGTISFIVAAAVLTRGLYPEARTQCTIALFVINNVVPYARAIILIAGARALMQRFYLPRVVYVALCHGGQTNARVNAVHRAGIAINWNPTIYVRVVREVTE